MLRSLVVNKPLLIGLLALIIGAVIFGVFQFLPPATEPVHENPRQLLPASAGLYAEISSLDRLSAFGDDVTSIAPQLFLLKSYFSSKYALFDKVAKEPDKYGIDTERPIGFAVLNSQSSAPVVSFIPINDIALFAEAFKKTAREFENQPTIISGSHAIFTNGYLIVAESVDVLSAAKELRETPISVPSFAETGDPLAKVILLPEMLRGADEAVKAISAQSAGMAQFATLVLQRSISNISGGAVTLSMNDAELVLRSGLELNEQSDVLKLFEDVNGPPPFLDFLPASALVGGIRVNPLALSPLAGSLLEELGRIIDDTTALELFEISTDVPITQSGIAIEKWSAMGIDNALLNIVQIPYGTEDSYVDLARIGQEKTGHMWEKMMASSGHGNSKMKSRTFPVSRYSGLDINGFEIKMTLDIEIPDGLPDEMRKSMEKIQNQTQVTRFAVVPGTRYRSSDAEPGSSSESAHLSSKPAHSYVIISTSQDPGSIRRGIDRALSAADSAVTDSVFTELIARAEPGFGYFLCDPIALSTTPRAASGAAPLAVFARRDGNTLRADLIIPRTSLRELVNTASPGL